MRNGRRLTAVGIITGGLLLVGLAAPSLADATSGTRHRRHHGELRRGPGRRVLGRRHPGQHHPGQQHADRRHRRHDGLGPHPGARRSGHAARRRRPGVRPRRSRTVTTDGTCADGYGPGPADSCVPDLPVVIPCLDPPDYNGNDQDGCGTDPRRLPPGQTDHNGNGSGCGTDPNACPANQTDYNGPTRPAAATTRTPAPGNQTDYNGRTTPAAAATRTRARTARTTTVRWPAAARPRPRPRHRRPPRPRPPGSPRRAAPPVTPTTTASSPGAAPSRPPARRTRRPVARPPEGSVAAPARAA